MTVKDVLLLAKVVVITDVFQHVKQVVKAVMQFVIMHALQTVLVALVDVRLLVKPVMLVMLVMDVHHNVMVVKDVQLFVKDVLNARLHVKLCVKLVIAVKHALLVTHVMDVLDARLHVILHVKLVMGVQQFAIAHVLQIV